MMEVRPTCPADAVREHTRLACIFPGEAHISVNLSQRGGEAPLRIYPGGIKTIVAWHEVPGKKKKRRVRSRRDG